MSNYIAPLNTRLDADQVLTRSYDEANNRLRVDAQVTASIGTVDVIIDASTGDNIAISDGVNVVAVQPDGSLNVNIVNNNSSPGLDVLFNSSTAVISGLETTIASIIAPGSGMKVFRIDVGGDNIATFKVKVNGNIIGMKRTFFGNSLNESFLYEPLENGLKLVSGDNLTVTVTHTRPSNGNFEVSISSLNL